MLNFGINVTNVIILSQIECAIDIIMTKIKENVRHLKPKTKQGQTFSRN